MKKLIVKVGARSLLRSLCLAACAASAHAQLASVSPSPTPAAVVTPTSAAVVAPNAAPKPEVKGGVVVPPEKSQPVRVPRFDAPPVIDGKLDEEVWKQAVVLKDFYQINPGDNVAPTAPTEFLIGYDSKFLYMAFRAFDDPSKVRATVARRDNVFGEDNVRVMLDTFNDQRKAYVLGFNPLGVQQDGIHTEESGTDFSVDIVMESKGALTSDGYIVEVAVPFKSLRYEAGKGKFWGFHVWRNIDRNSDEIDSWVPISRTESGTMNQAGRLTGLEGISTERTLELIPSLTVSETGRLVRTDPSRARGVVDFGAFVNEPVALDPGLTAKFVMSSAMTLDLAINPDFAQVEADSLVVTTNQRFPIFFAEKRPFFLEGIEIFNTPLTVVHTRAIVDPDLALKLSGKRGRNTYGVMFASDNGPGNLGFDDRAFLADVGGSGSRREQLSKVVDRNATIGVMRLKRDVGREHSVGLIATTYNFVDHHNHTAGVDGRFRLDKMTTFTFQLLGTNSRTPFFDPERDAVLDEQRGGFGYVATVYRQGRNWSFELYGEGRTRGYAADVGFTSRVNSNFNSAYLAYNSDPNQKAKLVRKHFHNFTHINYDFQRRMQIWESEMNMELGFQRNSYLGVGYEYAYERVFEEEFGATRGALGRRVAGIVGAQRAASLPQCDQTGTLPPLVPDDPTTAEDEERRVPVCTFFGGDEERSSSKNHYFLYGGFRPSKKYNFSARLVYRDGHFDYDFGAGRRFPRVSPAALLHGQDAPLDPGPGGLWEFRTTFIYQPKNELNVQLDYTKNLLRRYDTDLVAFDVNLVSLRSTYQFTRFLFARARVDYETLPKRARGQFLLGWTPNPGTSFYVGYNDDVTVSGFHRFNGRFDDGLQRYERTFFIKASYLFRKSF
ncbi:MAG TPA: DUF5916 domain-containing protein [Pyrinomonadaceae bacterium]|nr:DUF5916 domain-containing protein [Pyrinomonadaceae bacterium]